MIKAGVSDLATNRLVLSFLDICQVCAIKNCFIVPSVDFRLHCAIVSLIGLIINGSIVYRVSILLLYL